MFHRVNDAGKAALVHLVKHLRDRSFSLFDLQLLTPITAQLGGATISRQEYLVRLRRAVEKDCKF
jgi:leucyl/phenylalanyl-tRNA--protein transferase